MNRRNFLATASLLPVTAAAATIQTESAEQIARERNLVSQGRLKLIRFRWRDALPYGDPPEFPTGVTIRDQTGVTRTLPADAIQVVKPWVDHLYGAFVAIFAHESFPLASPHCHLPVLTYVLEERTT